MNWVSNQQQQNSRTLETREIVSQARELLITMRSNALWIFRDISMEEWWRTRWDQEVIFLLLDAISIGDITTISRKTREISRTTIRSGDEILWATLGSTRVSVLININLQILIAKGRELWELRRIFEESNQLKCEDDEKKGEDIKNLIIQEIERNFLTPLRSLPYTTQARKRALAAKDKILSGDYFDAILLLTDASHLVPTQVTDTGIDQTSIYSRGLESSIEMLFQLYRKKEVRVAE